MNLQSILILFLSLCLYTPTLAQSSNNQVKVVGAMRNVMRKGELHGTIQLDTIAQKKHLYGLGPLEYLKGELLIVDGKSYVSSVNPDGSIKMEETFAVKAPFFVYSNSTNWKEIKLPKEIKTPEQFESYLDKLTKEHKRPFTFRLEGEFNYINFHIQNLPDGTVVKSPADAHQGQGKFERRKVKGEIVGFFSTEHQTIFTHHDSFVHMHYINDKRTEMGHIDDYNFNSDGEILLYIAQ